MSDETNPPAPAPTPPPKPDALRLAAGWKGKGGGTYGLDLAVKREFGPLFGGATLWSRNQVSSTFVTPDPLDTLLFPKDHPLSGQARYRWEDRGDGVEFGYLVPEAQESHA